MSRLWVVRKEYVELVYADDDQDAYGVLSSNLRDCYAQNDDCDEIKTKKDLVKHGFDVDTIPWGGPDNVEAGDHLKNMAHVQWQGRKPLYVVIDSDVGERLNEIVGGRVVEDDEVCVEDGDVGRVIYKMPDGALRRESGKQREERLKSGLSDGEVAKDIELAMVREQLARLTKRLEVADAG